MSNVITEANWKFHWRLTESAGIMIYLAEYRGRRVLWEASLPYVTVDHQRDVLEVQSEKNTHLTATRTGLLDDKVLNMGVDVRGRVWVLTEQGISVIEPLQAN